MPNGGRHCGEILVTDLEQMGVEASVDSIAVVVLVLNPGAVACAAAKAETSVALSSMALVLNRVQVEVMVIVVVNEVVGVVWWRRSRWWQL